MQNNTCIFRRRGDGNDDQKYATSQENNGECGKDLKKSSKYDIKFKNQELKHTFIGRLASGHFRRSHSNAAIAVPIASQ